jgi:hypothetical protein
MDNPILSNHVPIATPVYVRVCVCGKFKQVQGDARTRNVDPEILGLD